MHTNHEAHSPLAPHVLFVCVKNGGKSQMAAALMRQLVADRVNVDSAGTRPGSEVNALSAEVVAELGASMEGEQPKQLTDDMLRLADRVIVIGKEAVVNPVEGMKTGVEVWETDEPSERGIGGIERMRLVRDDINRRVLALSMELTGQPEGHADQYLALSQELSAHYHGVFTAEEVRAVVRDVHAELLSHSKAQTFLPILVSRRSRAVLDERAAHLDEAPPRRAEDTGNEAAAEATADRS